MTEERKTGLVSKALAFLFLAAGSVVLFFAFYKSSLKLELPVGCDEFGYLELAKGIAQGRPFTTPTERPFDPELTRALRASRLPVHSYMHMIAPHAYHLDTATNKVINQYPPGTSLLLALLPFESAKRWSAPLFALFILMALVVAVAVRHRSFSFFEAGTAILLMYLVLRLNPLGTAFLDVNSIAPTLGLLIGAGYLLERRPGLSLAFLGLSCVFRLPNALLAVPLLMVFVRPEGEGTRLVSKQTALKAVKGALLFFVGGFWIYLAYAWILLGNPLRPTYSYIDQAFTLKGFLPNLAYYFNLHQPWFVFHLILLTVVTVLAAVRWCRWKWVALAFGMAGLNYVYYLIHNVHIAYYPYASAAVLLGLILGLTVPRLRPRKFAWVVPAAAALIILSLVRYTTHKFPRQDFHQQFADKVKPYTDCLANYDVVWSELRSSTVEYTTGKAGFRYAWGPESARKFIMTWLRTKGFRQAIWVSDLPVGQEDIQTELDRSHLPYSVVTCEGLGTFLSIPKKPQRLRNHNPAATVR